MKSLVSTVVIRSLFVAFLAAAVWLWIGLRPVKHPPGILITSPPATLPATPMPLPSREGAGDFLLKRIARVHAQGRVLAVHRYRDELAPLAPMDVVIGWGELSDSLFLNHLTVSQKGRSYRMEWTGEALLNEAQVKAQSANLHLIPGSPEAALWMGSLKPGMLIDLQGAITEVGKGSSRWAGSFAESSRDEATPAGPTLSGDRIVFVTQAHSFQGRSEQDLRGRALLRDHAAQQSDDLQLWFEALKRRREHLDVNDALAVREFNREAARYMEIAHPSGQRDTAPAALRISN